MLWNIGFCHRHKTLFSQHVVLYFRERMLRLQHENQQLKMQTTCGEDSVLLRSLLDDANVHKHELECQVRCVARWSLRIIVVVHQVFKNLCCS